MVPKIVDHYMNGFRENRDFIPVFLNELSEISSDFGYPRTFFEAQKYSPLIWALCVLEPIPRAIYSTIRNNSHRNI